MLDVEAPAAGKYDTSKTYHLPLTNLKTKEYHFISVKDKLRVKNLKYGLNVKISSLINKH